MVFQGCVGRKGAGMYSVCGVLMQLKLEPLVELACGQIYGFEVLSYPAYDADVNVEAVFEEATPLELWRALDVQINELRAFTANGFNDIFFFINVDSRFFLMPGFARILMNKVKGLSVALELSAPIGNDPVSMANYHALKNDGIAFWLDDYNGTIKDLDFSWDGVKLDKYFFWRHRDGDTSIRDYCDFMRVIFGDRLKLICEGIERESDVSSAMSLSARFGQGFNFETIYFK